METDEVLFIKMSYVPGLRDIVLRELASYGDYEILRETKESITIPYQDDFMRLTDLRTVSRIYLTTRDQKYNPGYIARHKSILGNLIALVQEKNTQDTFKTYHISCAGSDSSEVQDVERYIEETFGLDSAEEADLSIYISKDEEEVWEVGLQVTARPLSLRSYKVRHMSGAMDPTIAAALNMLCMREGAESYLNVFSGSGTLLIEAGLVYPQLTQIEGFDHAKDHLSLSIQNIKQAGLLKRVRVHEANILESPDLGMFDVITSDLPFGMAIAKGEDLVGLYQNFLKYTAEHLNPEGILGVYTSEFELFENLVIESQFEIVHKVTLDLITKENQYLPVRMIMLKKR